MPFDYIQSTLQCIITAFQSLKSHGDVLNVDLKDFFTSFYKLLLELPKSSEDLVPLTLKCLELMLYDKVWMLLTYECYREGGF